MHKQFPDAPYNEPMHSRRHFHRLATWLAMWALVLNALMPLAAQAVVAPQNGKQQVELCTATGMVLVQLADDDSPASGATSPLSCPWCATHGGSMALPVENFSTPLLLQAHAHPAEPYATVHLPTWWPAAQSRAPPAA